MSLKRAPQPASPAAVRALLTLLVGLLAFSCASGLNASTASEPGASHLTTSHPTVSASSPSVSDDAAPHCSKKSVHVIEATVRESVSEQGKLPAVQQPVEDQAAMTHRLAGPYQSGPPPPGPDLSRLSVLRI